MAKAGFYFKNAFIKIYCQKKISFIVILSIAVGMIFPFAAFAMANNIFQDIDISKYVDEEHTVVADFFTSFQEKEKMDDKLKDMAADIKQVGYFARYDAVVTWKGQDMVCPAAGSTLSYLELEHHKIVDGKIFNKKQEEAGARVCLLKIGGTLWKKGAKVGDSIKINNIKYRIIGAIRDIKFYGGIIVPYNSLNIYLKNNKNHIQYKALFLTDKKADTEELSAKIKQSDMKLIDVMSASEGQQMLLDSAKSSISKDIILGLFVLLFAICSFIFIIAGRVAQEQYSIGIKMAVGASKGMIFIDLLIQNMILILIAVSTDIVSFPLVKIVMPQFGFIIDAKIMTVMFITGVLLAFIATGTIFAKLIKKKQISELLKAHH